MSPQKTRPKATSRYWARLPSSVGITPELYGSGTNLAPLVETGPVNGSVPDPDAIAEVISGHDYPRMLYHGDGRTITVATPEEHDELMKAGWVTMPYPVHTRNSPTPAALSPTLWPFTWPFGAYRDRR
jgi:hypothetical protein